MRGNNAAFCLGISKRSRFDPLPSEDEYRRGFLPIIGMGDETQDVVERDATILRLHAAGKRWPVIMAAAGCSEGTAVTVVRRAGLPPRRPKNSNHI